MRGGRTMICDAMMTSDKAVTARTRHAKNLALICMRKPEGCLEALDSHGLFFIFGSS
jgi:hypothetical protein